MGFTRGKGQGACMVWEIILWYCVNSALSNTHSVSANALLGSQTHRWNIPETDAEWKESWSWEDRVLVQLSWQEWRPLCPPPPPFDHWSTGTTDPEQLNFPRSLTLGEGVEESSPVPARGELVSRKRFFTVLATGQAAG